MMGPYLTHRLPAQGASNEGLGVARVGPSVFFAKTKEELGYSYLNLRHGCHWASSFTAHTK